MPDGSVLDTGRSRVASEADGKGTRSTKTLASSISRRRNQQPVMMAWRCPMGPDGAHGSHESG
eukprot:11185845-Lingulodinium_polyedra.AAC.1